MLRHPCAMVVQGCRTLAAAVEDVVAPRHCLLTGNYIGLHATRLPCVADDALDALPPAPPQHELYEYVRKNFPADDLYLATVFARWAITASAATSAIIHAIKYRGYRHLATALGYELGSAYLHAGNVPTSPLVVPVPIHRARRRERGYNQAELIATGIVRATGFTCMHALRRTEYTGTQTALDAASRMRNVRNVFGIAASVQGRNIVVVDDVLTTGATVNACAEALLDAGARSVHALAIAAAIQ